MNMQLSEYEFDVTRELINIALANAADAFSKMTNDKVLIKGFDLELVERVALQQVFQDRTDEPLHVLTTQVKGNLEGVSYLIFGQHDTQRICKIFTPGQPCPPAGPLDGLQEALLLELDNILSAAVVTQLSNFLGTFMYGDVPNLRSLSRQQALASFGSETDHFDVLLHIHARFKSYRTNLQPSFLWFFKSDFLKAIHQLVRDKQQMSLLRKAVVRV